MLKLHYNQLILSVLTMGIELILSLSLSLSLSESVIHSGGNSLTHSLSNSLTHPMKRKAEAIDYRVTMASGYLLLLVSSFFYNQEVAVVVPRVPWCASPE